MTEATYSRGNLERALDGLIASLFPRACREAERAVLAALQQAARRRRAGDAEGALAVLSTVELAGAPWELACRAFSEWLRLARRVYAGRTLLLYRPGVGQAALLEPRPGGDTVQALAVLGLKWERGRVLSRRCLRGLRPLTSAQTGGGPCTRV